MTGGLGFVKDGMNSLKRNRRMLQDLNERNFKSNRPKSDFSRRYNENKKADSKLLESIRNKTKLESRRDLIKNIILIIGAVFIVVMIYFLPSFID